MRRCSLAYTTAKTVSIPIPSLGIVYYCAPALILEYVVGFETISKGGYQTVSSFSGRSTPAIESVMRPAFVGDPTTHDPVYDAWPTCGAYDYVDVNTLQRSNELFLTTCFQHWTQQRGICSEPFVQTNPFCSNDDDCDPTSIDWSLLYPLTGKCDTDHGTCFANAWCVAEHTPLVELRDVAWMQFSLSVTGAFSAFGGDAAWASDKKPVANAKVFQVNDVVAYSQGYPRGAVSTDSFSSVSTLPFNQSFTEWDNY
eukprot:INCI12812.1.p1 GENE.INCI12812.1~~INCI12812.1.p1  ORF type:complete len:255 (+),score=18.06 INCI12812.1:957-1721(+)